ASARLGWLFHHRQPRTATLHDVLRNLQIVGSPEGLPQDLRIFPPSDAEISEELRAQVLERGAPVVLVPGSAWRTKMWDWRGYREVARRFLAEGRNVVLLGAPAEQPITALVAGATPVIDLGGKTSIAEVAWVISKAAVVVCNDSMALHLASAARVPAVAVFCATSPQFGFGPWRNIATVLEVDGLACKPCSRHGGDLCPTGTWACSRELSPQRVYDAAREIARYE
ncbi:MAG: glycosyltransferase family 9 protein, partial [Proteobacteria bacterium]|nr:glycosyltransferase family 9 protein [Pseudomonadota bacterium]